MYPAEAELNHEDLPILEGGGSANLPLGTQRGPDPLEGERTVSAPNLQLEDLPDPCSFGIHDWVTKHNADRENHQLCVRCGQRIE